MLQCRSSFPSHARLRLGSMVNEGLNIVISRLKSGLARRFEALESSLISSDQLVIREVMGKAVPIADGQGLCLFSHFDPDGRVDDWVVYYLQQLHKLGLETVFVTTSEAITDQELDRVSDVCTRMIVRKNRSLDFGSWKVGLDRVTKDLSQYPRIVLANDSVYGPFFDLAVVFQEMESHGLGLWGITDTYAIQHHLQSYFLVFSRDLVSSKVFQEFWSNFRFYQDKDRIIHEYEIGLTEHMRQSGYRIGSWIDAAQVREDLLAQPETVQYRDYLEQGAANLTLFLWDYLIESCRMPFLKTELLKKNRYQSSAISRWEEIVRGRGGPDLDQIRRHALRVGNPSQPPLTKGR
jgi:lipopolysaccharide biosynthesis protein